MTMAENQTTPATSESGQQPATSATGGLKLTPVQALDILIQAVNLAQQKGGVYTLKEAALLYEAVQVFAGQQQQAQPTTDKPAETATNN